MIIVSCVCLLVINIGVVILIGVLINKKMLNPFNVKRPKPEKKKV